MNGEITESISTRALAVLEDTDYIEQSLAAFLDQFPYYQKHRDELRQECLLACAACALSASSVMLGCCRETGGEHTNRFRAEMEVEADGGLCFGGISESGITDIAAYLECFNYVYSQKIKKDCPTVHELLSPLSNMAFLAVTRVCGNSAPWSGFSAQGAPILHDFILPLLVEVFKRFSTPCELPTKHEILTDPEPGFAGRDASYVSISSH